MNPSTPRRFYREAAIVAIGSEAAGNTPGSITRGVVGWGIALDGKRLRSPAQAEFLLPNAALAEAIAGEWAGQGDRVVPSSMPLMQLAATAIDRVARDRSQILADLDAHAATDLICYRATEPRMLVARQQAQWDPLVAWIQQRFDVSLAVTSGIMAVAQPPATLAALTGFAAAQDDLALTALSAMAGAAGSLVIALALFEGRLSPAEAAAAAQLDELFQAERWGEDEEAARRRQAQRDDLASASRFLALLRQPA